MGAAVGCVALPGDDAAYLGAWLDVLCADEKAIYRAVSAASKGADFLLSFGEYWP